MSDAQPTFDQYGALPGHLVNAAKQVVKFIGYFLDEESQKFDWSKFRGAINNRPDDNMAIEHFDHVEIVQNENALKVVVDQISTLLMKVAPANIDQKGLAEIVLNAFTGLKGKEQSGFANYEKERDNSGFTYRFLFALPDANMPNYFYALVTTVKLVSDIQEKSAWFELGKDSRQNFSAKLDTIRLACCNDFIASPKPSF
ncbi:unnamed protein product [Rhizoctonia solani]|uniref:Uncharacterized protein n=1 Tax=Rhizoctonia solani TaxID=456999 RepID=A0A8H2W9K3_9AGAM|nr:unnamed protein product [Rhizoctonia solani]